MEYRLASSSTEEGEVVENGFPYYKSHLQYYYYPQTTLFIGKNSVPQFIDYKSNLICSKLKKDIKAEYSYLFFNLLDSSKTFFDNKFSFVKTLQEISKESDLQFELIDCKNNIQEISTFDKKSTYDRKYEKFYQKLLFSKENQSLSYSDFLKDSDVSNLIIIEDSMIEKIKSEDTFMFFRCIDEKVKANESENRKPLKKYIFEDIFYSRKGFYEYLDLYSEYLVKSFNSDEIRYYKCNKTLLIVYSGTVFTQFGNIKRLCGGLDVESNIKIICNKEGPKIFDIQGHYNNNVLNLLNIDLCDGDYVINKNKIYKISDSGESFEFKDIDFSDFTSNRWSYKQN